MAGEAARNPAAQRRPRRDDYGDPGNGALVRRPMDPHSTGQGAPDASPGGRAHDARDGGARADVEALFALIDGLKTRDMLGRAQLVKVNETLVQLGQDYGGVPPKLDHDAEMRRRELYDEQTAYAAS